MYNIYKKIIKNLFIALIKIIKLFELLISRAQSFFYGQGSGYALYKIKWWGHLGRIDKFDVKVFSQRPLDTDIGVRIAERKDTVMIRLKI